MELVGFGDLHIKPQQTALQYDALTLPRETDAVVMTGDVVHRVEPADIAAGREFFERLDEQDVPVLCLPGNHDPHPHFDALIEGFETPVLCHERVIEGQAFEAYDVSTSFRQHSFVGIGCESFDITPELRLIDFDSLDPRTAADRRFAADAMAGKLEDAVYGYVQGAQSRAELRTELGIKAGERSQFITQLDAVCERFDHVSSLLGEATGPVVFLSHVPPYNTRLDRHHSIGQREADLEGLHVGSLGLKLALRAHRPIAALSGHSHNGEYQVGIGDGDRPHLLNLDYRRPVQISVDGDDDTFSYAFKT